jgi:hypothetical protein
VYSTTGTVIHQFISGLEEVDYEVSICVTDPYGNSSDTTNFGTFRPLMIEELAKNILDPETEEVLEPIWSWVEDSRLYGADKWIADSMKPIMSYRHLWTKDSMRNASEAYIDGKIYKFWDEKNENGMGAASSYFLTGAAVKDGITGYWAYPFSYFIDLGSRVQLAQVVVWQHQEWEASAAAPSYARYDRANVKKFELWGRDEYPADSEKGSDLLTGWTYLGTYTILKSADEVEAKAIAEDGHVFDVINSENPELSIPMRYLRFKGLEPFGGPSSTEKSYLSQGVLAEIALAGRYVE